MAGPNRNISIHRCFFEIQAGKVRKAIYEITKKDSLSVEDTQAIRILTEVYDSLINPDPKKFQHHQEDCNNDYCEESQ